MPAPKKIFAVSRDCDHPNHQKKQAQVQPKIMQPAEMMITQLCDELEYPPMFYQRNLPVPAEPTKKQGFERVLKHMGGITYEFKQVPKFTPAATHLAPLPKFDERVPSQGAVPMMAQPVQMPQLFYPMAGQGMPQMQLVPMMVAMPISGMPMMPMAFAPFIMPM